MIVSPLQHLVACATCRLDPDQPIFVAEQNAIAFLLVLIMAMLAFIVYIFFNFARKARRAASSQEQL